MMDVYGVAGMVEDLAQELANEALAQGWRHMALNHGWSPYDFDFDRGDSEFLAGQQDSEWQHELATLHEQDKEGWQGLVVLVRTRVRQRLSEALKGGAR